MNMSNNETIVGKVVTLANGIRGKAVCQLVSGEYLLMTGKGGQISTGFYDTDVISMDNK